MDKQNHTDDDFAGYASWLEESGLFFVAAVAFGLLVWLGWKSGVAMGWWA